MNPTIAILLAAYFTPSLLIVAALAVAEWRSRAPVRAAEALLREAVR